MKLEREMFATSRGGRVTFHLVVLGAEGAIQFHFAAVSERKFCKGDTFPLKSLGVETHKRCVGGEGSNRHVCHILGGDPCYHVGISLWAEEFVMPLFMEGGSEDVFPALEDFYIQAFLPHASKETA